MKANELMIGDFCRCGEILVKITRISETSASGLDLSALSPIPLTAEILEKNGWSKEEVPSEYQCGVDIEYTSPDGRVIVYHFDTNSKEWGVHLDNYHFSTVGYFECDYAHELQHALRLCGLNELADNFKV